MFPGETLALEPDPLQLVVPPPPLSFPTPCRSPGGGGGLGDRHLVNPKFFVAAHCVVVG